MDRPSVRYANVKICPLYAQTDKPDIHHDEVERIQSHPHASGLAFCPLCSMSKYALCTRRRTIPISIMIMSNVSKTIRAQMDWPSVCHAQRQNMPSTRAQAGNPGIDTYRNTALYISCAQMSKPPIPARDFFTNQLFDSLWKGDVRDSSAARTT